MSIISLLLANIFQGRTQEAYFCLNVLSAVADIFDHFCWYNVVISHFWVPIFEGSGGLGELPKTVRDLLTKDMCHLSP
jgi:hypothetical protein